MPERIFRIPHGRDFMEVAVPEGNILGVLEPKGYDEGLDEKEIIKRALKNPKGSPRLSDLCMGKASVLLITNDMTRPMPSKVTIPALINEIQLYNQNIKITIIIASGLHRAMTRDELIAKMGRDIVENYRIVVHDAYDTKGLVDMGLLRSGNRLWLNREVTASQLVISEGFIEAHWLAGFSGGRKSILPGLAGAETVMNNHSAANVDHNMTKAGALSGNPVHEEFIEAASKTGLSFILNVVLDKKKKIIKAFAGDPIKAHEEGCGFVKQLMQIPCQRSDIVITSNSGFPLDINLYQSMKGMDTGAAAVKEGGVIIVSAECPEGIGQEGFRRVYESGGSLDEILDNLRSGKLKIYDQWGAQVMASLSGSHTIIVVTGNIDGQTLRSMYVEHAGNLQEALEMAFAIKGKAATVNIIPEGPVIIPDALD